LRGNLSLRFHGLDVVKTFRFDSSYVMTANVEVKRNGVPVRALLAWPAGLGDQTDSMQFAAGKLAWSVNGKDDSTDAKKVSGDATLEQPYQYAGIFDLYFAAAFLPSSPAHTVMSRCTTPSTCPAIQPTPTARRNPSTRSSGRRRHQRRHQSAPLRRPQGNRSAQDHPGHGSRRQARRTIP